MSKAENLVIMFTDIVGFTELTSKQSRAENEAMLQQNEKLLVRVAKSFGGKRIKSIGDALLLVFKSPTDSVHCAMAMHDALWEYNQSVDEAKRLSIRVVLNSGEVRITSGDIFGEAVNVAARLEKLTPPNEVYFTESVYLSMNKAEVVHELVGKKRLKGIPDEVTVYRVPNSASAQRLIAMPNEKDAKASKEDLEHVYPFGGMHQLKNTSNPLINIKLPNIDLPDKKIIASISAAILLVLAFIFLIKGDSNQKELEQLLQSKDLVTLETRITELLSDDPDDAIAHLMQGHASFENRRYTEALEHYEQALSTRPDLAKDPLYAKNLMKALSRHGSVVTKLAKLNPSEQVVDELLAQSIRPNSTNRKDAVFILNAISRTNEIDTAAIAILDLDELKTCDEKRAAIKVIADKKDHRGLPLLKKIVSGSVLSRIKSSCINKDVKRAIKVIEG